jgi:hypothetical protein
MRLAVLIFAGGLAACGGTKPYRYEGAPNVTVRSELDGGVRATLHVHQVNGNCETRYQGSLALDRSSLPLAIPAGRDSYLDVTFDTSSFLAGSRRMNAGTLVRTRAGHRYEVAVAYRGSLYQLGVRETDPAGRTRDVLRRELGSCSRNG